MRTPRLAMAAWLTTLGAPLLAHGYALNAHVAICQHVLEEISQKGGVSMTAVGIPDLTPASATADVNPANSLAGVAAGRPGSGAQFRPFQLDANLVRLAVANPSYFRAGCGAPDAFPFFGNTDPSHSYGWDPVTQSDVLWQYARTDQEKAWVIGWKAHLAMDGSVHGFANTYAAMAMKRMSAAAKNVNHPKVWDTFSPPNFMGHIAAESWVNQYFVYAARPENTKIDTPLDFATRMFMNRGSPIRRHYSNLLSIWKPGRTGDVKVAIGGEQPGVLATTMHRFIEHLNQFEEYHVREHYTWAGHARFYQGKDQLHWAVAGLLSSWHNRRLTKLRAVYSAWMTSTATLQQLVSARGGFVDMINAVKPFEKAAMEYLTLSPINIDLLPQNMREAIRAVQHFFNAIMEGVKVVLHKLIAPIVAPFIKVIKEMGAIATGQLMNKFFPRDARDHARTLLAPTGLLRTPLDGEPNAQGAGEKRTDAGIDGAATPQENAANRQKLLAYPFYRNAFAHVVAVLSNLNAMRGLPSADFTNGIRCTDAFTSTRNHPEQQFTTVLKGNDPWYNATVEACHTPEHTKVRDTGFLNYDYDAQYGALISSSTGYEFNGAVLDSLKTLVGVYSQIGEWGAHILTGAAGTLMNKMAANITSIWSGWKAKAPKPVAAWMDRVAAGVKKVVDLGGYNVCNAGCATGTIAFVTCWAGRPQCQQQRETCYQGCSQRYKR